MCESTLKYSMINALALISCRDVEVNAVEAVIFLWKRITWME